MRFIFKKHSVVFWLLGVEDAPPPLERFLNLTPPHATVQLLFDARPNVLKIITATSPSVVEDPDNNCELSC